MSCDCPACRATNRGVDDPEPTQVVRDYPLWAEMTPQEQDEQVRRQWRHRGVAPWPHPPPAADDGV